MRLSALLELSAEGLVPVGDLGADPDVRGVLITDLLDPGRYLSGAELVLTGLAWWRAGRPARSTAFVGALVRAGVAALAAGEAALGRVPADLVKACAGAGLPLLRVPVDVSFAVVSERMRRQLGGDEGLAAVLARHRELAAAVAARESAGVGLGTVLDLVGRELGAACWVLTATGRVVAGVGDEPDPATRRHWASRYLRAQPAAGVSLVDVDRGGRSRAGGWFLAITGTRPGSTSDAGPRPGPVVAELASLAGLELALSRRRPEAEVRLVAALGDGSPSEVDGAVRALGWPEGALIVVVGRGADSPAVIGDAAHAWSVQADEVVALVRGEDPAAVVATLRSTVEFLGPGLGGEPLRIGVSDPVSGGAGLLGAVAEARAVTQGPHVVAGPEALSSHGHLLAAVPVGLREAYRRRVLGPLLDHDRRHRTELVRTLDAYLASSGSWARCAADLHLHVNTVRYRIERIEALTGRDLRRLEDQTDLLLALRLTQDPT